MTKTFAMSEVLKAYKKQRINGKAERAQKQKYFFKIFEATEKIAENKIRNL